MAVFNTHLIKFLKFNTWLSGVGLSQLWHTPGFSLVKEDKRLHRHEAQRSGG